MILDGAASGWIGEDGEFKVAIPEALFKIVVKDSNDPDKPDVLAFIYPQVGPGYNKPKKIPYCHKCFLTSVDEIEKLTGLDFLTKLKPTHEKKIEKWIADDIWPAQKSNFIQACRRS